eukprot:scaffold39379_cov48-Phaeocystis_antarctica.AAC.1
MLPEPGNISREEHRVRICPSRIGGDPLQRRERQLVSEAPREHGGGQTLDGRCRGEGRLKLRHARRCVDRLLAVREEQHDLSRVPAVKRLPRGEEELTRDLEAVGDRGLAAR